MNIRFICTIFLFVSSEIISLLPVRQNGIIQILFHILHEAKLVPDNTYDRIHVNSTTEPDPCKVEVIVKRARKNKIVVQI